jgi:uncharacterized protein
MKKSELTAMTLNELKALAKKMKVTLPAGAKKADIVESLMATGSGEHDKAMSRKAEKPAAGKSTRSSETKPSGPPSRERAMPEGAGEPLMAQQSRVAESKYYTGPAEQKPAPSSGELPNEYGEDRIAILVRDPYVAYAYWEASPARVEKEKSWFGWDSKLAVRIYDVTGVQFNGSNAIGYFDQEVHDRKGNWYFDLGRPTHSFCADFGLLSPSGRFLTLARSNYINMPRDGVSDVIDEEWMLLDEDYWKMYGFPAGSSPNVTEMWRRMRMQGISSPGMRIREKAKK